MIFEILCAGSSLNQIKVQIMRFCIFQIIMHFNCNLNLLPAHYYYHLSSSKCSNPPIKINDLEINKQHFLLIFQLCKQFGSEAERHLLRCLFSSIDFGDAIQSSKNSLQAKLLSSELSSLLLNKSSFVSSICFAVDHPLPGVNKDALKPSSQLINNIAKSLNLSSQIQETALAIALKHSANAELVNYADQHLKVCLPRLIQSYIELGLLKFRKFFYTN